MRGVDVYGWACVRGRNVIGATGLDVASRQGGRRREPGLSGLASCFVGLSGKGSM